MKSIPTFNQISDVENPCFSNVDPCYELAGVAIANSSSSLSVSVLEQIKNQEKPHHAGATYNASVVHISDLGNSSSGPKHISKGAFSWHRPKPLEASLLIQSEFPVDACGSLLAAVISEIAEVCQAPEGLAAHSVLSASAFAVQRLYNCAPIGPLPADPCSLFVLSIAESGDRKSAVDRLASQQINAWEQKCVSESGFPFLRQSPDEPSRLELGHFEKNSIALFSDVTYADLSSRLIKGNYPAVGVFSDESGTFFGNYSLTSATRQLAVSGYATLWNTGEVARFRLTDEPGSGKVFNRRLGINLMAQPVSIQETLADPYLRGQGFLPRFLITNPPSKAGSRLLNFEMFQAQNQPSRTLQHYERRMTELLNTPISVDAGYGILAKEMPVNIDAQAQFVNLYNEFERELTPENFDMPHQIKPFQARVPQHARRLATILAVMNGDKSVTVDTMVSAFRIAEHSLETWKNLIGCSEVELLYSEAQQLLNWMISKPQYKSLRDIQRHGPRFVRQSVSRLRALLNLLEEHYWIRYTNSERNFQLNPKSNC